MVLLLIIACIPHCDKERSDVIAEIGYQKELAAQLVSGNPKVHDGKLGETSDRNKCNKVSTCGFTREITIEV